MRKTIFLLAWLLLVISYQAEASCDPNIPGDVSGDCKVDFNDFAIIASDWLKPSDSHEWVAIYNGPGNFHDDATAIAVDSLDNVYVTGIMDLNSYDTTSGNWATIKYDGDGNEVWVATYNGPNNMHDRPLAIAIDSSDNIYVTGVRDFNTFDASEGDWATIKYDADGNEVWVATYNGPNNMCDSGGAVAIDSSDNIYVAGVIDSDLTGGDRATIKYDGDGNEVWVATYSGPNNMYDTAGAIAIDSSDNIYVTGISDYNYGTGGGDYTTIKYNPDGNEVWVATYDGDVNGADGPYDIAMDCGGNVYVTGTSGGSGSGQDCVTVKYDPNGNQVWVARYNGPGNGYDLGSAIATDNSDNVYVTGWSEGAGTRTDYITIKYEADSNQPVWVARYNGPANFGDSAHGIVIDRMGNVYVTGTSTGSDYPYTLDIDYVTVKYSADSNEPVWVARYNGPGNGPDGSEAIAVDSFDNVYVTGYSLGSGTGSDFATVKYSPDYSCTPQITGDFDHNCTVNIYDLKTFCQNWLECNLDPPEDCWQ